MGGRRRWARRVLIAVACLLASVAVLLAAVYLWLRTDSGNEFLRARLVEAVQGTLVSGRVQVDKLDTNLWSRVDLSGVHLTADDGTDVLAARRVTVRLRPLSVLSGELSVPVIDLDGLALDLRWSEDGTTDLARLFGTGDPSAPSKPWSGLPIDISATRISGSDLSVHLRGQKAELFVQDIDLAASASLVGPMVQVRDLSLTGRVTAPRDEPFSIHGGADWNGDTVHLDELVVALVGSRLSASGDLTGLESGDLRLDLAAQVTPLDLGGLGEVLGVALGGHYQGSLGVQGPLSDLAVQGTLEGVSDARGSLDLHGRVDASSGELPWSATIRLHELAASDAYLPLRDLVEAIGEETVLDGTLTASGKGTTWPGGIEIDAVFDGSHTTVFDLPFDDLVLKAKVRGGVLEVTSLDSQGPLGGLTATGSVDLGKGPISLVLEGTFDLAELHRFGADHLRGRGWLRARIRGDFTDKEPVFHISGPVRTWGLRYGSDIRIEQASATVKVLAGRSTTVEAAVEGTNGDAYGVQLTRVVEHDLKVEVPAKGPIVVSGRGGAYGIGIPGNITVSRASGPWRSESGENGTQVTATMLVRAWDVGGVLQGDQGLAELTLKDEKARFSVDLAESGRQVILAAGTLDLPSLYLEVLPLKVATEQTTLQATRVAHMTLAPGGVRDADLDLEGSSGQHIAIRGTLDGEGEQDARVTIERFDLGLLAELFPVEQAHMSGQLDLDLRVGGTAQALVVDGSVDARGTWVRGMEVPIRAWGTVSGRDDVMVLDIQSEREGATFVDLAGQLPVNLDVADLRLRLEDEADLRLVIRPGALERFAGFTERDLPPGQVSGRLGVTGALGDPTIDVDAVLEANALGWQVPARVELDVLRTPEDLTLQLQAYEGLLRRGDASGRAQDRIDDALAWALGDGPALDWSDPDVLFASFELDAQVEGLPVVSLAAAVGYPIEVEGTVMGTVRAAGAPSTPVVESHLRLKGGKVGQLPLKGLRVDLEPHQGGYHLFTSVDAGEGRLVVEGEVPVYVDLRRDPSQWPLGDLDLTVKGTQVPLELLAAFSPDVDEASGVLEIDGSVGGEVLNPEPVFVVGIDGGSLEYIATGVRYKAIDMRLEGDREQISVTRLAFSTEPIRPGATITRGAVVGGADAAFRDKPNFEGTLSVRLDNWRPTRTTGSIEVQNMWALALPDQAFRVTGSLRNDGDWPELDVTGSVRLDAAYMKLDKAAFMSQGPLRVDPRMTIYRSSGSYRTSLEEVPSWLSRIHADVAVQLTRNVELDVIFPFLTSFGSLGAALTQASIRARLGGDVRVVLDQGDVQAIGEVEVVDGEVRVLQSRFELEQGTINFIGDPTDPSLDLNARDDIGTTSVQMAITGLASAPEIAFSSPDYSDESQVMSMLITGKEPQDLSMEEAQSADQVMMSLLLSTLLSGTRIGTISVDPSGMVRVGLPLGRVYAEGVYRVDPNIDENRYAVDFEIQLSHRFVLDGAVGDRHSWFDLFWEYRF